MGRANIDVNEMTLPETDETSLQALMARPVIIFDLFHTLSTMRHAGVDGPETHELLGISREEYLLALFGDAEQRLKGVLSDPVEIVADIARAADSPIQPGEYACVADHRARRFAESLERVSETTLAALDCLKGYGKRLALISNADAMEGAGWPNSPLASRFEVTIFSFQVGHAKPEPAIYNCCMQQLNAVADQCVYVGDGGSNEFDGARSVGIPSICTTEFTRDIWPERIPERAARADAVVGSLSELCRAADRPEALPSQDNSQ